ncbi:conserved exported hypothetical protein [Paraburkholderia ribeironis]|uniref:Uncharacterized protein n=1 Tax=Paraburkholderia ribeironis TaxID=1247936 RepID=A0A1N7RS64_9BURK|nr:DUF2939 domain-containing protein [Paraburkholderia ribeironis]SIT37929.1 conserved exported hypothetical protein [Paraburkholderia ribeironis]
MTASTRTKRSTARPLVITLVVIIVVAALGFAYASPYIALNNLKRAADARDAQTVNQYVDFPALRDSLKQQIAGLLSRRLDLDSNSKLATIGAVIGVTLLGPLVDAYATPDGVAALLNGMPPHGDPGERPPEQSAANNPPAAAAAAEAPASPAAADAANHADTNAAPPQRQSTAGYRGLNEFVVTYRRGTGDAHYSAIFRREGLFTWKLAAIDLNE